MTDVLRPSFATVLHGLKSPQNVGTIVRSHVAFDGGPIVFVGLDRPWDFRKSTQTFSRKLERLCELVFLDDDDAFFDWCGTMDFVPVAVEIGTSSVPLPGFEFPLRTALTVGNEALGLSADFVGRCAGAVVIPQFGDVACLNVGVACAIALYEMNRGRTDANPVAGPRFALKSDA